MANDSAEKRDKSQVEKFREAARELETDDSEEAFARMVKKIAKSKPNPARVPRESTQVPNDDD